MQGDDAIPHIDRPHTEYDRILAYNLLRSQQTIPQYHVFEDCRLEKLTAVRAQLNKEHEKAGDGIRLSVNDFLIKAAALVTSSSSLPSV